MAEQKLLVNRILSTSGEMLFSLLEFISHLLTRPAGRGAVGKPGLSLWAELSLFLGKNWLRSRWVGAALGLCVGWKALSAPWAGTAPAASGEPRNPRESEPPSLRSAPSRCPSPRVRAAPAAVRWGCALGLCSARCSALIRAPDRHCLQREQWLWAVTCS